jgi:hypothetical protein
MSDDLVLDTLNILNSDPGVSLVEKLAKSHAEKLRAQAAAMVLDDDLLWICRACRVWVLIHKAADLLGEEPWDTTEFGELWDEYNRYCGYAIWPGTAPETAPWDVVDP